MKGDDSVGITPNRYIYKEDSWCIVIIHKGDIYYVKIDEEDIPKLKTRRWYIGRRRNNLYVVSGIPGKKNSKQYLHRFLLGEHVCQVDHINGDTLDNRKINLRECDNFTNSSNKPVQKNNRLGIKNIRYEEDRNKYRVGIASRGRSYIERFDTLEEAISARDKIYEEWGIPCEREKDNHELHEN